MNKNENKIIVSGCVDCPFRRPPYCICVITGEEVRDRKYGEECPIKNENLTIVNSF